MQKSVLAYLLCDTEARTHQNKKCFTACYQNVNHILAKYATVAGIAGTRDEVTNVKQPECMAAVKYLEDL